VSSCESETLRGASYPLNLRWNGTHIGSVCTVHRPRNDLHAASGTGGLRKRPNASHHVRLAASYKSNARHPLHRFRLKRRACLFGSFAFPDDLSISNPYLADGFRLLLFSMIYIVITPDVKAFGTAQVRTFVTPPLLGWSRILKPPNRTSLTSALK
jgi:hypothetical protein